MTSPRRTAIVTSRLPRLIDPEAVWLSGLRATLRHICREGATLVVVDGTAGSSIIQRGAERLGLVFEKLATPDTPISNDVNLDTQLPDRDSVLFEAVDTVFALEVRTNGNMHRALRLSLQQGRQVVLVDLPGLQSRAVRDDLMNLGAKLWEPEPINQLPLADLVPYASEADNTICEVAAIPLSSDWVYLTHTTRACAGPWPEQIEGDYFDSLLDDSPDADHSTLAVLERIVKQRRLMASSQMIRGGYAMVCFTAVPLVDLPAIRQFRNHRTRWDFEPYGICIRRQCLLDQGVRPAIYGDDSVWQALSDMDRPYFQFTSQSGIDWRVEKEWRHQGDLDLSELTPDDVLLFVPRHADLVRLAKWSPWPITLWPLQDVAETLES